VWLDIIHGVDNPVLPRVLERALSERLRVMPAVVVLGSRQTGKSTLVNDLSSSPRRYYSLDDLDVLDAARQDPGALIGGTKPLTLDEVQREPDVLLAVKREIDGRRRPGQFLLTGSANLLMMRRVSESLAGRASYLTMWPMSRREVLGLGTCGIWEDLLAAPDEDWREVVAAAPAEREPWADVARRGGYPTPAVHMREHRDRAVWFDAYIRTYLERDLQELSSIAALPDFRRLMRATSLRLGQLVNQTELGRDVALPQSTVNRYLNLLETSFLLVRLPAYAVNRTKRLIKSPKVFWNDTGLAIALAGGAEPTGAHLENLVLHDLLVWRDARADRAELHYWRTASGEEVDLVIEADKSLIPIEIKATRKPRVRDVATLRSFRAEYEGQARAGLLLHDGDMLDWITPDVLAVPWWRIL
jgi:uncharacterized protein